MGEEKEITIYDIAQELNISAATVSRGLKDHPSISKKTKKKIQETAKRLGYRSNIFASNLRRQKTNTIGVIVQRLNSSFISDVLSGIEAVLNEAGYNAIISQSLESSQKEIANALTMFNNRVDGLLVSLSYDTKDISHFEAFIEKGIPVIFFDRVYHHEKCSTVVIDNLKAGYDVASHLLNQGAKKMVHITGSLARNVYKDRLEGFKKALTEQDIPFDEEKDLIINKLIPESGVEAAHQILKMNPLPDAVFVGNDNCAAACILELKKHGVKIPEDILFSGFNNDYIAQIVEPNLTTINYKGFEMGEITAQMLINHLNQTQSINSTQTVVLRHDLIIRESSVKPKNSPASNHQIKSKQEEQTIE
jgi:LacI family transcriptional regulator